jgi:hypothetical protein
MQVFLTIWFKKLAPKIIEIEGAKLRLPQVDKPIKTSSPSPSQIESRSSDVQAVLWLQVF